MSPPLRIHLGHHFYGSGNLGDDLMLAGLLEAVAEAGVSCEFTCCTAQDLASQQRRFPQVRWLPCRPEVQEAAIREADVWLGAGDTPFQTSVGPWFLEHLVDEVERCRQAGTPMYFLGIGVEDAAAAARPETRLVVSAASCVWARDAGSAALLASLHTPTEIVASADLAHAFLARHEFPPVDPAATGLVLAFEDPARATAHQLAELVEAVPTERVAWLMQEIRALPGSESLLHASLPPAVRERAPLRPVDYTGATSAGALLETWGAPGLLCSSRYHAMLIGAWAGARLAPIARSAKVALGAEQLGLAAAANLEEAGALLASASSVSRERLQALAETVQRDTAAFLRCAAGHAHGRSAPAPHRILIVRPDTYGDWILTEPLLRLARACHPGAEIALLLRSSLVDVAPLLGTGPRILPAPFNPHAGVLPADDPALLALSKDLADFAPDWVLAPTFNRTWLDRWVARQCPKARRLGYASPAPGAAAASAEVRAGHDLAATFFEVEVRVAEDLPEWEKLERLAEAVFGCALPGPPVLAADPALSQELAGELARLGLEPGKFVVCAPAGVANVSLKAWPAAHFAEVIAWLTREHGLPVLLCAHQSESGIAHAVRQEALGRGAQPQIWLGGGGDFGRLAHLQAHARAFFGNDTGPMHAAAAAGVPTLGVFGGGTWPRFQPRGTGPTASAVQPLACFGCGWQCLYFDAPCLHSLPPATVIEAFGWLLGAGAGEARIFEVPAGLGLAPEVRRFIAEQAEARRLAPPSPLERLAAQLEAAETDRARRLAAIEEQSAKFSALEADHDRLIRAAQASEADRAARLAVIEEQSARHSALEAEHDRLLRAMAATEAELRSRLEAAEADRTARLQAIEEQSAKFSALEAEHDRILRAATATEAELRERLAAAEADRSARLQVIEEQSARHSALEGEHDRVLQALAALGVELAQQKEDFERRSERQAAETAELHTRLGSAEADRAARLLVIEEQGRRHSALEAEHDRILRAFAELQTEHDRTLRAFAELQAAHERALRDHAVVEADLQSLRQQAVQFAASRVGRSLRAVGLGANLPGQEPPPSPTPTP